MVPTSQGTLGSLFFFFFFFLPPGGGGGGGGSPWFYLSLYSPLDLLGGMVMVLILVVI